MPSRGAERRASVLPLRGTPVPVVGRQACRTWRFRRRGWSGLSWVTTFQAATGLMVSSASIF